MVHLILGGAASGKSEYAESLSVKNGNKKLYIATMKPYDDEAFEKIARHQKMRAEKGFDTKEIYFSLAEACFSNDYDTVLLECLSNLMANEMFLAENKNPVSDILEGIKKISKLFENVFIVSNDIFSDGDFYSAETIEYMRNLGLLNRKVAEISDFVTEVYLGEGVEHKGAHK